MAPLVQTPPIGHSRSCAGSGAGCGAGNAGGSGAEAGSVQKVLGALPNQVGNPGTELLEVWWRQFRGQFVRGVSRQLVVAERGTCS